MVFTFGQESYTLALGFTIKEKNMENVVRVICTLKSGNKKEIP